MISQASAAAAQLAQVQAQIAALKAKKLQESEQAALVAAQAELALLQASDQEVVLTACGKLGNGGMPPPPGRPNCGGDEGGEWLQQEGSARALGMGGSMLQPRAAGYPDANTDGSKARMQQAIKQAGIVAQVVALATQPISSETLVVKQILLEGLSSAATLYDLATHNARTMAGEAGRIHPSLILKAKGVALCLYHFYFRSMADKYLGPNEGASLVAEYDAQLEMLIAPAQVPSLYEAVDLVAQTFTLSIGPAFRKSLEKSVMCRFGGGGSNWGGGGNRNNGSNSGGSGHNGGGRGQGGGGGTQQRQGPYGGRGPGAGQANGASQQPPPPPAKNAAGQDSELCKNFARGTCLRGNSCRFAHHK